MFKFDSWANRQLQKREKEEKEAAAAEAAKNSKKRNDKEKRKVSFQTEETEIDLAHANNNNNSCCFHNQNTGVFESFLDGGIACKQEQQEKVSTAPASLFQGGTVVYTANLQLTAASPPTSIRYSQKGY